MIRSTPIMDKVSFDYDFVNRFKTKDLVINTTDKENVYVRAVKIVYMNEDTINLSKELVNSFIDKYDPDRKIVNGIESVVFSGNSKNIVNEDMVQFMYDYLKVDSSTITYFYRYFLHSFDHMSKRSTVRHEILPRNIYGLADTMERPLSIYTDEQPDGNTIVLYMKDEYIKKNNLKWDNIRAIFTAGIPFLVPVSGSKPLMMHDNKKFIIYSHDGYGRPTDDFLQISEIHVDSYMVNAKTYLSQDYRVLDVIRQDNNMQYKFRPEISGEKYFMNANLRSPCDSLRSESGNIYIDKNNPEIAYSYVSLQGYKVSQFMCELGRYVISRLGLRDKLISAKTYDITTYDDAAAEMILCPDLVSVLKKHLGDIPEFDMFDFGHLNLKDKEELSYVIYKRIANYGTPESEVPLLIYNKYDYQVEDCFMDVYEFKSVEDKFEFVKEMKRYNILNHNAFRIGDTFMEHALDVRDIEQIMDNNDLTVEMLLAINVNDRYLIDPMDFTINDPNSDSYNEDILKKRNLVMATC